jgi:hypothetical protein
MGERVAFSDWHLYAELLDGLAAAESDWGAATDFAGFDAAVRLRCSTLVPNSGGYDELVTRLVDSGDYVNKDALFEHLRIVILAAPANEHELGAGWAGYWISRDRNATWIYAGTRGAPMSDWAVMTATANAEPAAAPAVGEQQFDEASGRWRRWSADGEFEFHHDADRVWERVRDNRWARHHDGVKRWLPYDEPSRTWLYENTWVPYERVGAPSAGEDLDALAERLVSETLADLAGDIEPLSEQERAEAVAILRRELEQEGAQ